MKHYYNEIDPVAAQWLRNLIAAGELPPGDVDERSIEDVLPAELDGYVQCHFFAGIGGWPLALRLAGWPVDKPIWTGSCPCQPFSAAGKGAGFADERHLWPAFNHLIAECNPPVVVGEQVASKPVDDWIDLVHADLEVLGYAFGSVTFPAASVGAPHIRDRNYWCGIGLANTDHARLEGWQGTAERSAERPAWPRGVAGGMADADGGHASAERQQRGGEQRQQPADGGAFRLANPDSQRRPSNKRPIPGVPKGPVGVECHGVLTDGSAGPLHGFWRAADWLLCRDGKWRPVEPGTFPLAHGISNRVGRLRAYGNAINPWQAAEFLRAALL